MVTTESICYRNQIAHISAGSGFCSYVDWDFFVQLSEYYTITLKVCNPFFNIETLKCLINTQNAREVTYILLLFSIGSKL
jgi:hypothetical protein